MLTLSCRSCHTASLSELIDFGPQPVAHNFLAHGTDPDPLVHPLRLHRCEFCGLIQIVDPINPELLYKDYNYCFSTWKPQPHALEEADLVAASASPAGSVLEIGCNDGFFLDLLRERGVGHVEGIEPNPLAAAAAEAKGLSVTRGMLSEACEALSQNGRMGIFDVVVARQVLEHIVDLDDFFDAVQALLKPDGRLFVDIPDFEGALQRGDCSSIWEEHVSYFTRDILLGILARHGFAPETERQYNFSGGTLAILAKRTSTSQIPQQTVSRMEALAYPDKVTAYGKALRERLAALREAGFRTFLYGAGCRSCTVINALKLGPLLDAVVDDQPEKQGRFMPGSKLPILALESGEARDEPAAFLLGVNMENEGIVSNKIRTYWSAPLRMASICSPNNIMAELDKLTP
ncbi:class I SAM-dependent methyltransferase [Desulfovibrio sp. TomC]|uniref:class I SAM-dependent methyltransferase n=1 Tax=Desulfovibrio sp. TomC TaxID=1562888 RepID=UPI000573BE7D|nr:class I SAM-dependent methyltransferase [Desulfovibrio sp. TomC]KHK00293.1 C-methyltransferase [Desulfovibrio sp. TomC]